MINWEKFLFILRSALDHFPLTFLCSGLSGWVLHLSVPLVQPSPTDERCNEQIVMVLTFRGTVNIAARARIRSTPLFTSWNSQRDLCRVISLLHDSWTIFMDWLLSLWSKEHCPPTSDLMNSKHPFCFVRGSRSRKREFPWNIYNLTGEKNICQDNIIEHFSCLKKKHLRTKNYMYIYSTCVPGSNPSSKVIVQIK